MQAASPANRNAALLFHGFGGLIVYEMPSMRFGKPAHFAAAGVGFSPLAAVSASRALPRLLCPGICQLQDGFENWPGRKRIGRQS
jgi:hypothetical protein